MFHGRDAEVPAISFWGVTVAADSSIAIVGGGPIGLALALNLDMYGVKSTIFNTDADDPLAPQRQHP